MTTPTPPLSSAAQEIAWSQCPARDGFKCVMPCTQCRKKGAAALIFAAWKQPQATRAEFLALAAELRQEGGSEQKAAAPRE
jgi:hypothetical protein